MGCYTLRAIKNQLLNCDEVLMEIRERLEHAHQQQKCYYDYKHRDMEFAINQGVWLHLLHRPIASLDRTEHSKLGSHFYTPFQIIERIGDVAS
jgi:hypothetical protein